MEEFAKKKEEKQLYEIIAKQKRYAAEFLMLMKSKV